MDFNYWIEIANKVVNIITGPAVIFSVWFVVAQIQTQIKVGKAASRQSIAEAHQEVTLAGLDPLLILKIEAHQKKRQLMKRLVLEFICNLRARENHFYQHKMGMLDDEEWKTLEESIRHTFYRQQFTIWIFGIKADIIVYANLVAKIVDEEIDMRRIRLKK